MTENNILTLENDNIKNKLYCKRCNHKINKKI
jgi:regulator of replication initiation timing